MIWRSGKSFKNIKINKIKMMNKVKYKSKVLKVNLLIFKKVLPKIQTNYKLKNINKMNQV
jgi:hypothetical protein